MIYPQFLDKGDAIGVAAPSLCITESTDIRRFNNGISKLEERGYKVKVADNVINSNGSCYTPPEIRVNDYEKLFNDDSVKYIISAKGGESQFEMLDILNWDMMKKKPKWLQGYSDNTNIIFKYTVDCDVASIYGSNFGDYGMEPWFRSVTENIEYVEGIRKSQTSFPYHEKMITDHGDGLDPLHEEVRTEWICSGEDTSFEGRLIGGCMDVIDRLIRNESVDINGFLERYSKDGIIWFMETYDMTKKSVTDLLKMMGSNGYFDHSHAMIFGRPLKYDSDYVKDVTDCLSCHHMNLVFGADIGHLAPRMVMINGAYGKFKITKGKCELSYEFI